MKNRQHHGFPVLLDVDGVGADFVKAALGLLDRRFGRKYRREQVTQYDFASLPGWDEVKDEFWKATRGVGFAAEIEPFPGAREGIEKLREIADVYFVTSPMHRSPTWTFERDHWLERHFDAHHSEILHVRKKELVTGRVFVDDLPLNVEAWRQHHPNGHGIVWAAPYNEEYFGARISTWEVLLHIVGAIKATRPGR